MRRDLRIVAADVRRRRFLGAWLCRPPPHVGGYGIGLLPVLLGGCSRAPSFDIVGSFFPAWLICLIVGILLASFTHWVLSRFRIILALPILAYPCLAALLTFLLWLLFFS